MKQVTIILFLMVSVNASAQSLEETSVRRALERYMTGLKEEVQIAFDSTATMKYVHFQTGEFKSVPIAEYISRLRSAADSQTTKDVWKREIVHIDVEGTAAQAKIKIDAGTMMVYDYMSLLKINGEWKIVSKIFYRDDK